MRVLNRLQDAYRTEQAQLIALSERKVIGDAIARVDWKAPLKVGWDPLQVEPSAFSFCGLARPADVLRPHRRRKSGVLSLAGFASCPPLSSWAG